MGADEPPNELEHAQAARVIGDLVGDGDDLVADSQDRRHAVPRAIAAFVVTLVAAAAVVPGVVAESQANSGQIGREAGSLSGMNTKLTSIVTLAATGVLTSSACAVPPSFALVADSQTQFSANQGQDGWRYLFDRGEGTSVEQMPSFVPNTLWIGSDIWCVSPEAADFALYCVMSPTYVHANASYDCSGWRWGLLRPIRQWTPPVGGRWFVEISIEIAPSVLAVDLLSGTHVVATYRSPEDSGSGPMALLEAEIETGDPISIRVDPRNGCHSDGRVMSIRIYSPDCDSNGIADAVDIAANPGIDTNHDGIPDTCQCRADLFADGRVDGADLGALLSYWGPVTTSAASRLCDISGDGRVDGSDLGILLANWGPCGQ